MNNNEHIDTLIAKFLTGEASDAEKALLVEWTNTSSENKSYFDQAQRVFESASAVTARIGFNTDAAWEKVRSELYRDKNKSIVRDFQTSTSTNWIRIAAMIVLVAGAGYGLYRTLFRENVKEYVFTSSGETVTQMLTDSTQVVLNRNSRINCTFSEKSRKVTLSGEAFFNLAADPNRPFEVYAGGLTIHDIGTSFNVDAVEGSDTVLVYVESGEVILKGVSEKSLRISAGGKAAYIRSRDSLLQIAITDTNELAWKTKVFVFENAGLESVAQKIAEVYNLVIEVSPSAKNCRITATFINESPENVIDVIAETLQLKVKRDNDRIILEGGNCGDEE